MIDSESALRQLHDATLIEIKYTDAQSLELSFQMQDSRLLTISFHGNTRPIAIGSGLIVPSVIGHAESVIVSQMHDLAIKLGERYAALQRAADTFGESTNSCYVFFTTFGDPFAVAFSDIEPPRISVASVIE